MQTLIFYRTLLILLLTNKRILSRINLFQCMHKKRNFFQDTSIITLFSDYKIDHVAGKPVISVLRSGKVQTTLFSY